MMPSSVFVFGGRDHEKCKEKIVSVDKRFHYSLIDQKYFSYDRNSENNNCRVLLRFKTYIQFLGEVTSC